MIDRFCDECLVDLGLHPSDEPWGCDIARQKAELLDHFAGIAPRPEQAASGSSGVQP